MNYERSQPRNPGEPYDVRRPRQDQDHESERYQRGRGERYERGRPSSTRYGDPHEYGYGDDFGSERANGPRYGSQRGGNGDWRPDRSGGSSSSYHSYDEDGGGVREGFGPRDGYGAPGLGYGQSQGGSFGGHRNPFGSSGQGYGGRSYYSDRGQGRGQTSYRGDDGASWNASQRGNLSRFGSQQGRGPYTGKGPKNYTRSDQAIIEDANQALERHGEVDASEIEVTCNNSVITLTGKVEDRRAKRDAEECVERVYGVTDVMNELEVDKNFSASSTGKSSGGSSSDDKSSSRSTSSRSFQKNT